MKQEATSNPRIHEAIQRIENLKVEYADIWSEVESACSALPCTPTKKIAAYPTIEESPDKNKIMVYLNNDEVFVDELLYHLNEKGATITYGTKPHLHRKLFMLE